jgi:hypothetical protein
MSCIDMGRVYIFRDVIFDEAVFPFSNPSSSIVESKGGTGFDLTTNHLQNLFSVNSVPAAPGNATNYVPAAVPATTVTASAQESAPNESLVCGNHSPAVSGLLLDPPAMSGAAVPGLSASVPDPNSPVAQSPASQCPVSPLETAPADSPAQNNSLPSVAAVTDPVIDSDPSKAEGIPSTLSAQQDTSAIFMVLDSRIIFGS